MDEELRNLQIDRSKRRSASPSKWAARLIVAGIVVFVLLGAWRLASDKLNAAPVVEVQRVKSVSAASAPEGVVLNATGYIVAAHKIQVAAKVIGKVKWIGVEKGDRVKEGDVLVRLEDDEYQAQLMQGKGQLANLQAKLQANPQVKRQLIRMASRRLPRTGRRRIRAATRRRRRPTSVTDAAGAPERDSDIDPRRRSPR
jgi:HlyD family secretion protein